MSEFYLLWPQARSKSGESLILCKNTRTWRECKGFEVECPILERIGRYIFKHTLRHGTFWNNQCNL